MHVGLCLIFQNLDGKLTDAEVYEHELALAARAEDAGFASVWTPEHHFSDYQLTPNVPMFLAWLAGRTSTIRLGTTVTVLPWHDPVRVAESFSLLDHLSGGRAILGIGRGLGRIEFDGFRLEMGESRRRFTEYTEAVLQALERGSIEYDGELYHQPRIDIRPRPLGSFRGVHLQRYARSTVEHYEFDNVGFADIEGYEYYAGLAKNIARHGLDKFNGFLADLQVWGTPDQVTEKLLAYAERIDAGALMVTLSYGGMDPDVARANYDLFARRVLPEVRRRDAGGDIGVRYATAAASA